MEVFLYLIGGTFALMILYYIFKFINKKGLLKFDSKIKTKKEEKHKELVGGDTIRVVEKYMFRREVKVLIALNQILPRQFISLPKVAVANLIEPVGSKQLYNSIKEFFVDFVVFEEATMKPLLVVDVYDNSFDDELLKNHNPELIEIFKKLKIKVIDFAVKGDINMQELKEKLYLALGLGTESRPEQKKENK